MVELTGDDLDFFSGFERVTRVMPTDYIASESTLIFLVDAESLGKAIGKKAVNIEKLRRVFRKRVVVVADSDDPETFLRSFFGNVGITDVEIRDVMGEKAIIIHIAEKDRGIAIGRNGERIKAAKTMLMKKFKASLHLKTRRAVI